jgi:hypothetical protein
MKHLLEYDKYVEPNVPISEGIVDDLYPKFVKWVKSWYTKIFGSGNSTSFPAGVAAQSTPPEITGEHMLYVPHQQGGRRTAKLFLAAKGQYNLTPEDVDKLKKNMPSADPGMSVLNNPKASSKDKALAYFKYWKGQWDKYSKEAKQNIVNHKEVKTGISSISPKYFSQDFLETVAWIESRFDPKAGAQKTFKGLFQIGPDAMKDLKRKYPDRKYSKLTKIPMDTKQNPQMGNDYLNYAYDRFKSNLAELETEINKKA